MHPDTAPKGLDHLDAYIRQGEPAMGERATLWRTAIGLQAVDTLQPSDYLLETASRHIEGAITLPEAEQIVSSYYRAEAVRREQERERTREADIVSVRIARLLSQDAFRLSMVDYIGIHRYLFDGLYPHAGRLRDYNISKAEWVLDGASVQYGAAYNLEAMLEYDLAQERSYDYRGRSREEMTRHLAEFMANLWQIHPFGEGNTRTTAVFVIKYLRALAFEVTNEPFAQNSWYLRNALVRANYNDFPRGVYATPLYLCRFFDNLLWGAGHSLSSRELHIRASDSRDH